MDPKSDINESIREAVKDHKTWWWKLLHLQKWWRWLLPALPVISRVYRKPGRPDPGTGWMTTSMIATAYIWSHVGIDPDRDNARALSASELLFQGVFVLSALLSVSMALLSEGVLKSVVAKNLSSVVNFTAPFVWALTTGVAGATVLFFYPDWIEEVQYAAVFAGVYAAMMQLNAMTFVIRLVILGMLRTAKSASFNEENE